MVPRQEQALWPDRLPVLQELGGPLPIACAGSLRNVPLLSGANPPNPKETFHLMTKEQLLQAIITDLSANLTVLSTAARAAHEAATHEECMPDNKYDTTALEASYIAQGQANRAQEIRAALESYRTLTLRTFDDDTPIRLTALVTVEADAGNVRRLFLGPQGR